MNEEEHECHISLGLAWQFGCIDGVMYGPCGDDHCPGQCQWEGLCKCDCHE